MTNASWYTPAGEPTELGRALQTLDQPVFIAQSANGSAVYTQGTAQLGGAQPAGSLPLLAYVPALTGVAEG